jgi:CheY-specific phosphatase CheX
MPSRYLEELLNVQFFGEYLIDRWVINREHLLEALDYQMKRNERFGAVALRRGFLTQEQVLQVNELQRRSDETFGELAVRLGHLSVEQVGEIVKYQRNNNIFLGEALLRLGFISDEVLRREIRNYHEHQRRYRSQRMELGGDPTQTAVLEATIDLTRKMFRRVIGVAVKIGPPVLLEKAEDDPKFTYFVSVQVPFLGEKPVHYVLSVSEALARRVIQGLLDEDPNMEEAAALRDAVRELANIVCGNAVAKLAKAGIVVDIGPPVSVDAAPAPPPGYRIVAFPTRLIDGGADLRFFVAP